MGIKKHRDTENTEPLIITIKNEKLRFSASLCPENIFLSFDFQFVFHVELVFFLIVEFIFEESQALVGHDAEAMGVSHFPLPTQREKAFIQISCYIRMYV